jgi:flagellar M-ring protein FliF
LRTNEEGGVVRVPRTEEELAQITANVKTAVGFNAARGDKVSVINASFVDEEEEIVEEWYEQTFVWDIAKQISGAMIVLFLIFIIIRPILRSLSNVPEPISEEEEELGELEKQKARMQEELEREIQVADYETNLQTAKNLAKQDPKRVATVVRAWVLGDMGLLEEG